MSAFEHGQQTVYRKQITLTSSNQWQLDFMHDLLQNREHNMHFSFFVSFNNMYCYCIRTIVLCSWLV